MMAETTYFLIWGKCYIKLLLFINKLIILPKNDPAVMRLKTSKV